MQFSLLYGQQLDIELGSADRTQLFTTARRQKAINDAMHNFERITSCTPIYDSIPIVDGTAEYDLLSNFPSYISLQDRREPSIKRVDSNNNVTWIQGDDFARRDATELDRENSGWQADPEGTPTFWYLREDSGTTFLGMNPPPNPAASSETWMLWVPYLAQSSDMAQDTDQPFTVAGTYFKRLVPYHQGLVHYAAGLLEPLRKNYDASQRQMNLYAGYVSQYMTKTRRDGPDQVTFANNYLRAARSPFRTVDPHRFP